MLLIFSRCSDARVSSTQPFNYDLHPSTPSSSPHTHTLPPLLLTTPVCHIIPIHSPFHILLHPLTILFLPTLSFCPLPPHIPPVFPPSLPCHESQSEDFLALERAECQRLRNALSDALRTREQGEEESVEAKHRRKMEADELAANYQVY